MREQSLLVPLLFFVAVMALFGKNNSKTSLTVRAVTHASRINEQTSSYTTHGTSSTSCSASATTTGNTTNGTTNCQTTTTPAQTHRIVSRTLDVMNIVEASGMRYVISCRANWVGSNCAPMIDGDLFPAEVDGRTMWIIARRGGNQGKQVRVKYKILDIRLVSH